MKKHTVRKGISILLALIFVLSAAVVPAYAQEKEPSADEVFVCTIVSNVDSESVKNGDTVILTAVCDVNTQGLTFEWELKGNSFFTVDGEKIKSTVGETVSLTFGHYTQVKLTVKDSAGYKIANEEISLGEKISCSITADKTSDLFPGNKVHLKAEYEGNIDGLEFVWRDYDKTFIENGKYKKSEAYGPEVDLIFKESTTVNLSLVDSEGNTVCSATEDLDEYKNDFLDEISLLLFTFGLYFIPTVVIAIGGVFIIVSGTIADFFDGLFGIF